MKHFPVANKLVLQNPLFRVRLRTSLEVSAM